MLARKANIFRRGVCRFNTRKYPVFWRCGSQVEKDTLLFTTLSHAVLTDEELALAVRTSLVEPWLADLIGVIDRAVERGELPSRPAAADFLPELLLSVAVTRPLIGGRLADSDYLAGCVDQVLLPALLTSGSGLPGTPISPTPADATDIRTAPVSPDQTTRHRR